MKLKRIFFYAISITALTACKPEIVAPDVSLGDVDPSRYVAIGSTGTSGYADDALHNNGQSNSYAAILAKQFSLVSDNTFNQPFVSATSVGVNLKEQSRLVLGYKTDCNLETSLSPVREALLGDLTILGTNIYSGTPFNNLGVPNLSILDVNNSGYGNPANGPGNYNPYYARSTSDQINGSILSDATIQDPSFFTLELGEGDIMNYALSGGESALPPNATGPAGTGFDGSLDEIIIAMKASGANGAIANIPDVMAYPYFTTIPYNGLDLDAANNVTLNNFYNPIGIFFQEGDNPFVMEDPSEPFLVRKMLPGELILLGVPLDSIKCYGMGSVLPIPAKYILSLDEIAIIETYTIEYNNVIAAAAQSNNLAFVDANSLFNSLNSGIVYNGVSMSSEFITGGAFSLDGRNLNPIGQALLANKYIESINLKFNASIPYANVIGYSGIIFP
ncbi:MAG: hypothetical protein ACI837_002125 [Crocinitomicaceae bacterium]|jgi:hypothetical protein